VVVTWNLTDKFALFAAALVQEANYHMIAEQLPGSSRWDWSVWRPVDRVMNARHGRTNSGFSARAAAERAVNDWNEQ
jgi:hypothetical protein